MFRSPHIGPNIIPNTPFLAQLLRHAQHPNRLAIRDANYEPPLIRNYADIILDAITLRELLRQNLPRAAREKLDRQISINTKPSQSGEEDAVYIGVLAPGGYEYVVAVVAVWMLGACVVPMTTALPVEEALYFVRKSQQSALLTSSSARKLGEGIIERLQSADAVAGSSSAVANDSTGISTVGNDIVHLSITFNPQSSFPSPSVCPSSVSLSQIVISSTHSPASFSSGIIIFTSGTTGPPKGAVLPNAYISEASRSIADFYAIRPHDLGLHLLPVHHVTGLAINILPFLIAGACVEFKSGGFDAPWTWDRWRDGLRSSNSRSSLDRVSSAGGRSRASKPPLTVFSAVPTIYMRLMRYYQSHISRLPPSQRKEYEDAARGMRAMLCGTSALPWPVAKFWKELTGRAVLTRYGSTEAGAVLGVPFGNTEGGDVPDGAVGTVIPGCEIQLAGVEEGKDGEGEILVKSPHLFSGYLNDPAATLKSHDAHGFFLTGDIALRRTIPTRSPSTLNSTANTTAKPPSTATIPAPPPAPPPTTPPPTPPKTYYHILGRANIDIIKSGGYKLSALDLEREILALPYISEVVVVGVDDLEFGQRVGAIVTLRDDQDLVSLGREEGGQGLTIGKLRDDLRDRLAGYKLPTLLRVLEGELPKTASGKVVKKVLGMEVFPVPGWGGDAKVTAWKAKQGPKL